MKYEFAVVGSGIGGLTVAGLLARHGRSVVVVERKKQPGGALRRFVRRGVPFDIGCHYTGCLQERGILRVIWEYLGVMDRIVPVRFPEYGSDVACFRDGHPPVHAFFNHEQFASELYSHFPGQKDAIDRYFKAMRDIAAEVPFYNLDLPLEPFLRGLWKPAFVNLSEFVKGLTSNSHLQSVFCLPTLLYGTSPSMASLGYHAMVAWSYLQGAWTIRGGGQHIADVMLDMLDKGGVPVVCGMEVDRIDVDGGRVAGIGGSGNRIDADNVIFAAHPAHLPDMLPDGVLRPAWRNRMRSLENSWSMYILFGALPARRLSEAQVWQNLCSLSGGMEDYEDNDSFFDNGPMVFSTPSAREIRAGDNGLAGVTVMKPAWWKDVASFASLPRGKRTSEYHGWKQEKRDRMLGLVKRNFGSVMDDLEPLAFSTPLTLRDELNSPQGGVYGVKRSASQISPAPRTSLPGLWLTGQNTLMTGIVGASISALATAGEILGHETLWDAVRQYG